jgi:hypothetical protein
MMNFREQNFPFFQDLAIDQDYLIEDLIGVDQNVGK